MVALLCRSEREDIREVDSIIDKGYLSASSVEAVAKVLGIDYRAPQQTKNGKTYVKIKSKLSSMDVCNACADNIATEYAKNPDGSIKRLVDAALAGDLASLKELHDSKYAQPIPEEPILYRQPNSNFKKLQMCFLGALIKDAARDDIPDECVSAGIELCKSQKWDTSIQSGMCANQLTQIYQSLFSPYEQEVRNYVMQNAKGDVYVPMWFDIRAFHKE